MLRISALLLLWALPGLLAAHSYSNDSAVMFWRFQKVGSTTLASMITSFAVRHEKPVKQRITGMQFRNIVCRDLFTCDPTKIRPTSPVYFSLWHEACDRVVAHERLKELFGLPQVQEIALFRDPVDRAVSAYYFWGEIGKEKARRGPSRFPYHGNMSTAPPPTLAMAYAENPMFMRGPPGPTYSSTFWASTVKDSLSIMRSRIFVLILERFDESLVLLRNHLGWKLADFVHVKLKRAKPHAKASEWPEDVIDKLHATMSREGESDMYNAAMDQFERQIAAFPGGEAAVKRELEQLKLMRKHVEKRCSDVDEMKPYHEHLMSIAEKRMLVDSVDDDVRVQQSCSFRRLIPPEAARLPGGSKRGGLTRPDSRSRKQKATSLFEDEDEMNEFAMFHYYSFPMHASDLCSSCEAHALQWAMESGYPASKLKGVSYASVPKNVRNSLAEFRNCPRKA